VESSTSRLSLAPDDHSVMGSVERGPKTIGKAPLKSQVRQHQGAGPDRHQTVSQRLKVPAVMKQRTRITGQTDSGTQQSAVKITPATHSGPVTTTCSTR
jgi:hypothetical protein